jgi:hypothetical protein
MGMDGRESGTSLPGQMKLFRCFCLYDWHRETNSGTSDESSNNSFDRYNPKYERKFIINPVKKPEQKLLSHDKILFQNRLEKHN